MEVVFLLSAEIDLVEAYRRHGESLYTKIDTTLTLVRKFPEIGPVIRAGIRRKLVRRTSCAIFYVIEANRVVVHAVVDQREDPKRMADRLRGVR